MFSIFTDPLTRSQILTLEYDEQDLQSQIIKERISSYIPYGTKDPPNLV